MIRLTSTIPILTLFLLVASVKARTPASPDSGEAAADTTHAVNPDDVKRIAHQLIAPCCWSEPADVHRSPAAKKVQAQVRDALRRGWDDQRILDAFVASYGERILTKPKARGFNLTLWILPVLAIITGGWVITLFLRRYRTAEVKQTPAVEQLDAKDAERLEREMKKFGR